MGVPSGNTAVSVAAGCAAEGTAGCAGPGRPSGGGVTAFKSFSVMVPRMPGGVAKPEPLAPGARASTAGARGTAANGGGPDTGTSAAPRASVLAFSNTLSR